MNQTLNYCAKCVLHCLQTKCPVCGNDTTPINGASREETVAAPAHGYANESAPVNMEPTTKPDETAVRCTSVMGGTVCNGVMRRGIAIPPAIQCSDEGTCSYAHWSAVAPRVSVLKCERCGHSFVPPIDGAKRRSEPSTEPEQPNDHNEH